MQMTFKRLFLAIGLSVLLCAHANADTMQLGSMARADFERDFMFSAGQEALIGGQADRLYFATKDGAVAVTGLDGKTIFTLQAKDAEGNPVLKSPRGVAVTAEVIYVVDSALNQIAMFSKDGVYQASFGAGKGRFFGSSGGVDIKEAKAVVAHEGVVYVLDKGGKKIQMFGSNGVYLSALELTPSGAAKPPKGEEEVHLLKEPVDLRVDVRGHLYVLDAGDALIKVYQLNGEYLRHLPKAGRLAAFAVAQDGVYVADYEKLTIQKYDFNDAAIYRFGSKGREKGQFQSISDLQVVQDREVVIGDGNNKAMSVFVTDMGDTMESVPKPMTRPFVKWEASYPVFASKLVSDGADYVYGINGDEKSIVRFKKGVLDGQFKYKDVVPVALALDAEGGLWVLDDKKSRVIKLDDKGNITTKSFGSSGSGAGQFSDPTGMTISASGRIYVTDSGADRVQVFSRDGIFQNELGKLDNPMAVSVSPQETVFVLDKNKVLIFSAQLVPRGVIDKNQDDPAGKLDSPQDILATSEELMVLDNNQVKVYTHAGKYLRSFAIKGKNRGELNEPISIAKKDEVTFYIADKDNNRIQVFSTYFKPSAPQQVVAIADAHAIHLRWSTLTQPYIKQYVIYRSKDENRGFVRVASSTESEYFDRGLEAEGKYYYRVGAVTAQGYEGQSSELVSAIAMKYKPPLVSDVKIDPSPWRLKFSWKPIESEYMSAYRIYQKDGDVFTLLMETVNAEFVKGGLLPNTGYTYYLSAVSKDGLESEKLGINSSTSIFNKPPLEIEILKLRNIFSNSYKVYEQDGVGTVRLINNTDKMMESVQLSFVLKDFMDYATETTVNQLAPGQSVELSLKAVFNNNILTVTEDSPIQTLMEASYFENGKREVFNKTTTVNVYEKHKLLWDERARYAAFITPKDPPVIAFARSIASQFKDVKDETQLASVVFHALGVLGLTYVPDPTNPYQVISNNVNVVDYIQFPRETLAHKSGDCDDLTALYSAMLESLGIETRVVEVPGHMLMMFASGAAAEDGYTMDDMYVTYEGRLWVPVETTLLGSTFLKAWEKGAESYYKYVNNGLTILDVRKSWLTYKPASLPDERVKTPEVTKAAIEKKFPNEFKSMLKISANAKTHRYQQSIETNSNDPDAYMQIGIVMAKQGDVDEAIKYFDRLLVLDPKNAAALNNKGNLLMMDEKFIEAQNVYLKAAEASPEDPYILVSLAKAYRASNNVIEAKRAFARALKLDATMSKKYKALALELKSTL